MHKAALKACVMAAGASVVAAATHANVDHAGGYGSPDAPLIIALAVLLSIGMAFAGLAGHRLSAVLLGICILSGEAYWVLTNAEREVARRELQEAPTREARDARMKAEQRVADALVGVAAAAAAVTSEAAKKDCLKNCAALLTASQTTAQNELAAARNALTDTPPAASISPLPDRLGIASWLWDLVMAGLEIARGGRRFAGYRHVLARGSTPAGGCCTTQLNSLAKLPECEDGAFPVATCQP